MNGLHLYGKDFLVRRKYEIFDNSFDDVRDFETLALADWSALGDLDGIADTEIRDAFGIREEFFADAVSLAIERMEHRPVDRHRNGVGHFRRGDSADLRAHEED